MSSAPAVPTFARGDCFALVGDHYRVLATSAETGGLLFAIETTVSPGGGTPPHIHSREDESFFAIDGTLEFWSDGKRRLLQPGEFAFGPRGVTHHFRNPGTRPVRLQVLAFPGDAERFFAEAAQPLPSDGQPIPPPNAEALGRVVAIAAKHGITILPPPT
jgi:quercetin dioxygenase-like cupin family protein